MPLFLQGAQSLWFRWYGARGSLGWGRELHREERSMCNVRINVGNLSAVRVA